MERRKKIRPSGDFTQETPEWYPTPCFGRIFTPPPIKILILTTILRDFLKDSFLPGVSSRNYLPNFTDPRNSILHQAMRSFMYIAVTWKDPWAGTRRDIFQEIVSTKKKNGAQCFDIGDLYSLRFVANMLDMLEKRNNNITSHRLPQKWWCCSFPFFMIFMVKNELPSPMGFEPKKFLKTSPHPRKVDPNPSHRSEANLLQPRPGPFSYSLRG